MNLKEFLQAVVPDGQMVVGWKDDRFHNTPAPTQAHALQQIVVKAKLQQPPDIYYALATFKQGWHKNAKGKSVLRVRDNVDKLKALWFDIDFKDGLSNPTQVVAALREFSKRTRVPSPSILVHSGNGIHCYWPLTTAVSYQRWQVMADKLKELAREATLPVDLVCTADACRVLRPPGTKNWKDTGNPKPVRFLYTSDKLHCPDALEKSMGSDVPTAGDLGVLPGYMVGAIDGGVQEEPDDTEFTGMHSGSVSPVESFFENIIGKCGVARHWNDTRGADCSEPEWTAALQILKHCKDRDMYVHEISKGHIDYDPTTTTEKFQQRLENDAGPTLCSTLVGYREDICKACPHFNKIKTPLVLGVEVSLVTPTGVTISSFRPVPGGNGMERKMLNAETNQYEWIKVLRHRFDEVEASRSVTTKHYDLSFKVLLEGAETIEIILPSSNLGNDHKLKELMAAFGVPLLGNEMPPFKMLMGTWLAKLQSAREIENVTECLGWVRDEATNNLEGFSAGTTTYLVDGTKKEGVRIKREYAPLGRMYEPKGDLAKWKGVAKFITEQNNPSFTAILASAFAAPLLQFTGIYGGILSIVSPESGVGKSSAMKCAQAVWGSPTHGMNSVDDTKLSVARKLGFLNNLPAYWDELRGKEVMEGFTTLAFQISQGKEKTRLDSSANMREVNTWETMLIAASNESIFDYMGQTSQGSDAGVARTFEIIVQPFQCDRSRAELAMLFEQLTHNYGAAGQLYAQHLATNYAALEADMKSTFTKLCDMGKMRPAERIWFAIISSLIVGAKHSNAIGLTSIDLRVLSNYLIKNVTTLRARAASSMVSSTPQELIAAFMQQHQDRGLIVEELQSGSGGRNYVPQVISPPRADRIVYQTGTTAKVVRVSKSDFLTWLRKSKEIQWSSVAPKFKKELNATIIRRQLGFGTKWQLPRQAIIEMDIDK